MECKNPKLANTILKDLASDGELYFITDPVCSLQTAGETIPV